MASLNYAKCVYPLKFSASFLSFRSHILSGRTRISEAFSHSRTLFPPFPPAPTPSLSQWWNFSAKIATPATPPREYYTPRYSPVTVKTRLFAFGNGPYECEEITNASAECPSPRDSRRRREIYKRKEGNITPRTGRFIYYYVSTFLQEIV